MQRFTQGLCRALVAVAVLAAITGLAAACAGSATGSRNVEPAVLAEPTAVIAAATDVAAPTSTEVPTAVPTATLEPTPEPVVDAVVVAQHAAAKAGLDDFLLSPLECVLAGPLETIGTNFECAEAEADRRVSAVAAGRVVMSVQSAEGAIEPPPVTNEPWTWERGLSLGSFVVVDHGSLVEWGNVMTVYAGLDTIEPTATLGAVVSAGDVIGTGQLDAPVQYEIWTNGWPHGTEPLGQPEREATPLDLAPLLARVSVPPAPPECPFPFGDPSSLPNTARPYRNGVHRGVDLVCGAQGRDAYAFADGVVSMVVRGYDDATTADREALLISPEVFGGTPHWTLTMLFGNFVVVDHGVIPDVGRTHSIYAHLQDVDDAVQLGVPVTAGQRLGEIGDRGTSQGAAGTTAVDPSRVHLHWELFVEHEYFGVGLTTAETEVVYHLLLCDDPLLLNGC